MISRTTIEDNDNTNSSSRMLWDRWPSLPFHAVAPWPYIENTRHIGQCDWIEQVNCVESWLESSVGCHYVDWTWDMWTLKQAFYCGVAFKQERSVTLFLLRFGTVD